MHKEKYASLRNSPCFPFFLQWNGFLKWQNAVMMERGLRLRGGFAIMTAE